jgi:hypothetical protein
VDKARLRELHKIARILWDKAPQYKIKKLAHSFWNISIYNLLGRNNPYSIYFVTENGKIKGYKTSIFSIPVPTITYNFKF